MKKCSTCKENKDLSSFNKDKSKLDGLHHRCKVCARLSVKKWQDKNKEQTNLKSREWKIKNKDKVKSRNKSWSLKKYFNLSLDQYHQMLSQQNFACYICKRHQSTLLKALAVDHNHSTGKVRGLLCSTCNSFLGYIKEDPSCAKNIIEYINKYENTVN